MEEIRILGDLVADLLNQGYCLDLSAWEPILSPGDRKLRMAGKELVVDEVYRCLEYEGARDVIYVFALSSLKYGIKGIVVNLVANERVSPVFLMMRKVKTAIMHGLSKIQAVFSFGK